MQSLYQMLVVNLQTTKPSTIWFSGNQKYRCFEDQGELKCRVVMISKLQAVLYVRQKSSNNLTIHNLVARTVNV